MHFAIKGLFLSTLFCAHAWAVEPAPVPAAVNNIAQQAPVANPATARPATAQAIPNAGQAQTAGVVNVAATSAPAISNGLLQPSTVSEEGKPLTAEQIAKQKAAIEAKVKALVKDQATRLAQLEKANLDALAQNQELQLKNDNLGVQVQVLQSERSAQMFLYGAATIAVGIFLGFLIASYIYTKRRRQW